MPSTSQTAQTIIKNSEFFSNISWYEITKDFSGPVVAIFVIFLSVWFAFRQINKQHEKTLEAQIEATKRSTKIDLFKELSRTLVQYGIPISETGTYCRVKKFTNSNKKAEISHKEFSRFMEIFGNSTISIILKVEANEIINQKLFRVFRFALSTIQHDFMAIQFNENRYEVLEKMLDFTSEVEMYISDFQICLQNMAYSDIFNDKILSRVPIDKRIRVITNDEEKLDKLLHHFNTQTAWGRRNIQLEKEAEKRYKDTNKNLD